MPQYVLQEIYTRRSAGSGLVADDTLDRLEMAKAPELKTLFDIDQLLRHFVRVPVLLRLVVDELEHLHQLGVALVRLRPVALDAGRGNG